MASCTWSMHHKNSLDSLLLSVERRFYLTHIPTQQYQCALYSICITGIFFVSTFVSWVFIYSTCTYERLNWFVLPGYMYTHCFVLFVLCLSMYTYTAVCCPSYTPVRGFPYIIAQLQASITTSDLVL